MAVVFPIKIGALFRREGMDRTVLHKQIDRLVGAGNGICTDPNATDELDIIGDDILPARLELRQSVGKVEQRTECRCTHISALLSISASICSDVA